MNKEELPPLHKDTYYFGFGIDIEKPIEMANKIIELQQENKILKENAKHNDKVVDKVNWENMLLKKENKKQQEVIDKAIDYINEHSKDENGDIGINLFSYDCVELLNILNEVSE